MSAMRDVRRWSRRDRPEVPARVPAPLRTEPLENRLPAESGLYPLFVKLQGRRALVVGGGPIGFQKTIELLRSGARVHAVATAWIDDFAALDGNPALTRSTRPFSPSDVDGVLIAIAATGDDAVQDAVWRRAEELGVLCNVVDVPERCHFYVPASLRRGSLTVSVSTEGKSPLLAAALRDRLAARIDPQAGQGLERLAEARRIVRERHPREQAKRRATLAKLLSPCAIDDLLEGRLDDFETHWKKWTSSLSD
jgi:precorrin-2 dehydrogenase/sirohydrochlorin ferrochelatase